MYVIDFITIRTEYSRSFYVFSDVKQFRFGFETTLTL